MNEQKSIESLYLNEINEYELLKKGEDQELIRRAQNGDEEARDRLIHSNLRFVVMIASKYKNRGIENGELISLGNYGMIRSIPKYKFDKGANFITFSAWWIKQAIKREMQIRSKTKSPREATIKNLFDELNHEHLKNGEDVTQMELLQEIEERFEYPVKKTKMIINKEYNVVSIDREITPYTDTLIKEKIEDETDYTEKFFQLAELDFVREPIDYHLKMLGMRLGQNYEDVIRMRFRLLNDDIKSRYHMKEKDIIPKKGNSLTPTLKKIGEKMKLTRERIRQIEAKSLKYLKDHMERDPVFGYVDKPSPLETYRKEHNKYDP